MCNVDRGGKVLSGLVVIGSFYLASLLLRKEVGQLAFACVLRGTYILYLQEV
jgi:hypothetical protein